MDQPFAADGPDVIVAVWAVPGASRSEITGVHGDALRVRVAQPPAEGRANEAIARLLGERVGARVTIEQGSRSRRKRFRIHQVGVEAVRDSLLPGAGA